MNPIKQRNTVTSWTNREKAFLNIFIYLDFFKILNLCFKSYINNAIITLSYKEFISLFVLD